MTNTFRGRNSIWKSTVTIASLIRCFKHQPRRRADKNTSINLQMCLRLHRTEHAQIDSCSPEGIQRHHVEISVSPSQMHIQQQRAHLQKATVFKPTSCTNRQCISLDRFVVHLRVARWGQERDEKTLYGRIAPVQDSSGLTFVRKSCSSHDREKSTFGPQKSHEVFV